MLCDLGKVTAFFGASVYLSVIATVIVITGPFLTCPLCQPPQRWALTAPVPQAEGEVPGLALKHGGDACWWEVWLSQKPEQRPLLTPEDQWGSSTQGMGVPTQQGARKLGGSFLPVWAGSGEGSLPGGSTWGVGVVQGLGGRQHQTSPGVLPRGEVMRPHPGIRSKPPLGLATEPAHLLLSL